MNYQNFGMLPEISFMVTPPNLFMGILGIMENGWGCKYNWGMAGLISLNNIMPWCITYL